MIKNYIKMAFRNILKFKGYSFLNIFGLALGLASCLYILLWVQDELSYDKFLDNADNIYRVEYEMNSMAGATRNWIVSCPLGPAAKDNIPEVENYTRDYQALKNIAIGIGNEVYFEKDAEAVDPTFLQVFRFPLLYGNSRSALNNLYSVVITENLAKKYFGTANAVGKSILINNKNLYTVSGVLKNLPTNTIFKFSMLIPIESMKEETFYSASWNSFNFATWLKLNSSQVSAVEKKITALHDQNTSPSAGNKINFRLMRLTDINLYGRTSGHGPATLKIQSVYTFAILALLILIIACINFMNLSTARSAKRALEVGLRKVVGAEKKHLMIQFYIESVLMTIISLVVAILILILLLPIFNNIAGKDFTIFSFFSMNFILGMLFVTIVTGLISGSYPALILSSFKPIKVLSGKYRAGSKGGAFRRILVVTQYSLSIILFIGMIVVSMQLNYVRNFNPGYDKEQLLYIPLMGESKSSFPIFKEELLKDKKIISVSGIQQNPTSIRSFSNAEWEGRDRQLSPRVSYASVDFDYVRTMKIPLIAGRSFSKDIVTDSINAFMINEELAKEIGGKDIVGRRFKLDGNDGTIIGVMKNFHYTTVQEKIGKLAIRAYPPSILSAIVRVQTENVASSIEYLKNTWKKLFPSLPFDYKFFNDAFDTEFKASERMGSLLKFGAFFAILIASLGLFGLSSFMAERKTKEIGIRKTLGATVSNITYRLSREFVILVIMANLIAIPIGYYFTSKWLEDFAYKITMSGWIFVATALITITLAIVTVSYQSIKAASVNPVDSLKHE